MEAERVFIVRFRERIQPGTRQLTLVTLHSTVLNLPVYASEADIRDRHRALSLIYHPDKQRDERTKDTAMKSFLEIQKAYESTFSFSYFVRYCLSDAGKQSCLIHFTGTHGALDLSRCSSYIHPLKGCLRYVRYVATGESQVMDEY